MRFYSTNRQSPLASLSEAVMKGLAPDGGLYMPEEIPRLSPDIFKQTSFPDIALEAGRKLFADDLPDDLLCSIIEGSFDFAVPLVELEQDLYVLELFHGPTLAFKDFAARFMARLIGYFIQLSGQEITILVATSGDTGSAVAHGFLGVEGINTVILYPSGKVSELQEKQLTAMGENVTALEVAGTFDDCQKMVKQAFLDKDITKKVSLVAANSINIARLLPQTFYYLYLSALLDGSTVSVPSGNFGNLTAGIIAKRMGAPINKFIAACNSNDTVPQYLKTGKFEPKPSLTTISNAMDVGDPSNFVRLLELYDNNVEKMREDIQGISFTDEETKRAIKEVYEKYGYIMDPHGAVAYLGLTKGSNLNKVFIETAHPAKFAEVVEEVIETKVPIPDRLAAYLDRKKNAIPLNNDFGVLKEFLLN